MKNSKKILFALVLALFALFVTACSSSKMMQKEVIKLENYLVKL